MIAVDWGTSSFRAYLLASDGGVREKRAAALGILQVQESRFAAALESQVGDWLEQGNGPVLMSGMIGSRQGWKEAPYAACPAGVEDIAAAVVDVSWEKRRAWITPGVSSRDAAGVPDVMRGEETQLLGVLDELPAHGTWVCLPGTHSKWARVQERRILGFTTHMTGELFATLKAHSILGRMMTDAPVDEDWFDAGVERARSAGGLLHHLFGVRARGLFNEVPNDKSASYLSGILIGHELGSVQPAEHEVYVLGASGLEQLYRRALARFGCDAIALDPDAAVRGLYRLAQHLPRR